MPIFNSYFSPGNYQWSFSTWWQRSISIWLITRRRFNFLYHWGPLNLRYNIIILIKHDFTQSDPLDQIFGCITQFFAFVGIIKEKCINFILIKLIDVFELRVDNIVIIFLDFFAIEFSIVDIFNFHGSRADWFNCLFPLENALYTVDR